MTSSGLLEPDEVRPTAIAVEDDRDVVGQPLRSHPRTESPCVERVDGSCERRAQTPAQPGDLQAALPPDGTELRSGALDHDVRLRKRK